MVGNWFRHNGFFGNPTHGDFGNLMFATGIPQNCFLGNLIQDGTSPSKLEQTNVVCGPLGLRSTPPSYPCQDGRPAGHPGRLQRSVSVHARPTGGMAVESVAAWTGWDGHPAVEVALWDVTGRSELEKQPAWNASHDPLTGLGEP